MDDLKLYAATEHQLKNILTITEQFSTDINMEFGISKCKISSIVKGKFKQTESHTLQNNLNVITGMEINEYYKYLGYNQTIEIEHSQIKKALTAKYKKRIEQVLKTELSARNKTKAINTYAIPILTYSFGIIKWSHTDLEALNTLTRTICYKYRLHHIHSSKERFTLPRKEGGRGFIDITNMHYKQIQNLRKYFYSNRESNKLYRILTNLNTTATPLHLNDSDYNTEDQITTNNVKKERWKNKMLHGKHMHQLTQKNIDTEASNTWLTKGNIFAETEGFMLAIQDQIINTRNYSKYIIKDKNVTTDECRKCHKYPETIDHVIGGCPIIAPTDYTLRHNNVAKIIHQQLGLKHKLIKTHIPTYKYNPANVIENEYVKLYWNRDIITDKTIAHNRPDITIIHKKQKSTQLIEISIPNSTNIEKKYTEKIEKYVPLAEEIKKQWKQKIVTIIPIIISTTGIIPQTLHNSLKKIDLHQNTYIQMQKSVIIDTCSIARKFLSNTTPL